MQEKNKNAEGRYSLKGSCLWGILLFAFLILADQLTKIAAELYFTGEGAPASVDILPGWLSLRLVYNRGISYGLGSSAPPIAKIGVIAGTAILMTLLAVFYFRMDKRRSFLRTACVFVVAGGVGNLVDRLYYRVWEAGGSLGVRDMVDLSRFGFAVCNFADFFISAGAVMFVLAFLFLDRDAFFPVGKYKALAKEAAEKEESKKSEKEKSER